MPEKKLDTSLVPVSDLNNALKTVEEEDSDEEKVVDPTKISAWPW